MTGFFGGWSTVALLTFFSDVVLLLAAGWGFAKVSQAALRPDLKPVTRWMALAGSLLVFGALIAKGLGLLG